MTNVFAPPTELTTCSYMVDGALNLVAVGPGWAEFARANETPALADTVPLGRSLRSFISDGTTEQIYDAMFMRVATTGLPVSVPIRCDAPALRRFMTLTVAPAGKNRYVISTVTTRTEPRERVALLDPGTPRSNEFIRMCSWCKRVNVGSRWCEVEEAVTELRLLEQATLPAITHGVCNDCYPGLVAEIMSSVKSRVSCTWTAGVSGGSPAFSYVWQVGTKPQSSDTSTLQFLNGGTGFTIYVNVQDANGTVTTASKSVTVSSSAPDCP